MDLTVLVILPNDLRVGDVARPNPGIVPSPTYRTQLKMVAGVPDGQWSGWLRRMVVRVTSSCSVPEARVGAPDAPPASVNASASVSAAIPVVSFAFIHPPGVLRISELRAASGC